MTFPQGLAERVRALADGSLVPVPPRDAATVVLLRDGPEGPQAYLLRRISAKAFGKDRRMPITNGYRG